MKLSNVAPAVLLTASTVATSSDNDSIAYSACPLIRAYYPPPVVTQTSKSFQGLVDDMTSMFDTLVKNSGSDDFGPITSNTTSFSVVLFGGNNVGSDDPVFFEYHYTAPADQADPVGNLTDHTKFPVCDLTMVFTVYSWLIQMGDQWEVPITKYLPELQCSNSEMGVQWEHITIGALAGHMSGLSRESYTCTIGQECDNSTFLKQFASQPAIFLPDTTPMVSYAAFQLLALAMEQDGRKGKKKSYASTLQQNIFTPLNMTTSSLLSSGVSDIFGSMTLNMSRFGEPAALSMVTSINDIAKAGHAMLTSKLIAPAVTRRWLQHTGTDTSNLRNGVGKPWEIYRSGSKTISPVLPVLTKSGLLGKYASYFGLIPDFQVGFAIVAHDNSVEDRTLDLNVYADVVSESLGGLQQIAAAQLAAQCAGGFTGTNSMAVLNVTRNGPGLVVEELKINGRDLRAEVAAKLNIEGKNLDFRLYPTNVGTETKRQFVAVFQDISAPIDQGTPTCITWQEVGAASGVDYRFVFELGSDGSAAKFTIPSSGIELARV